MTDVLVENVTILTMDSERRILDRGWIAVGETGSRSSAKVMPKIAKPLAVSTAAGASQCRA